jgi:ABC-type multidrug transport system fused ATPase/permease subunit
MVIEEGSHDELLGRNGFYKELYDKQVQLDEVEPA